MNPSRVLARKSSIRPILNFKAAVEGIYQIELKFSRDVCLSSGTYVNHGQIDELAEHFISSFFMSRPIIHIHMYR